MLDVPLGLANLVTCCFSFTSGSRGKGGTLCIGSHRLGLGFLQVSDPGSSFLHVVKMNLLLTLNPCHWSPIRFCPWRTNSGHKSGALTVSQTRSQVFKCLSLWGHSHSAPTPWYALSQPRWVSPTISKLLE